MTDVELLYPCCCGLDVHKKTVVACLVRTVTAGVRTKETRTFATTSAELETLRDWLAGAGCTHAAMESTGVLWKPVYNVLAAAGGGLDVRVVNAAHVKAMPGRKTDVGDAEWIADLLQHGLLRPSFIPDQGQRELRDLTRTRTSLIDERSAAVRRLQKVLEDANIKLSGVATDVMGVSGRAMLAALLAGTADPAAMAELAKGKLRTKRAELERALTGRMRAHHRRLVAMHLAHIDFLDEQVAELSARIAEHLRPFEAELLRLETIPGVKRRTAEVLAAEIGLRMAQFPSARHLAAWAGMAPGNNESAGKRKGGKTRKGSKWLRRALVEAARAAARTKQPGRTAFAEQYRRLVGRAGPKKAAVAVGHAILTTVYYLLSRQTTYRETAPAALDERRRARLRQRALDHLAALGYHVTLAPKEVPA
ncbi:MAG TPA: IS110 family transposase [Chloroflexota bacterium]